MTKGFLRIGFSVEEKVEARFRFGQKEKESSSVFPTFSLKFQPGWKFKVFYQEGYKSTSNFSKASNITQEKIDNPKLDLDWHLECPA